MGVYDYLGKAESYPYRLDSNSIPVTTEAQEMLEQSMICSLEEPEGERFYDEGSGSKLHQLAFEPNDDILASLLVYYAGEVLARNEKRVSVNVNAITVTEINSAQVILRIPYTILSSNEVKSLVYPFNRQAFK